MKKPGLAPGLAFLTASRPSPLFPRVTDPDAPAVQRLDFRACRVFSLDEEKPVDAGFL